MLGQDSRTRSTSTMILCVEAKYDNIISICNSLMQVGSLWEIYLYWNSRALLVEHMLTGLAFKAAEVLIYFSFRDIVWCCASHYKFTASFCASHSLGWLNISVKLSTRSTADDIKLLQLQKHTVSCKPKPSNGAICDFCALLQQCLAVIKNYWCGILDVCSLYSHTWSVADNYKKL